MLGDDAGWTSCYEDIGPEREVNKSIEVESST